MDKMIGQIGSQLHTTFFLFDNCIVNPETISIDEFERMLDTDETVAVGIQFLIASVLVKIGEYQHENPKIAAFVNENFEGMQGNLLTAVEDMLSAVWAGYSATEIVWKADGGQIKIDRLATYHPKTIYVSVDRQTGDFQGFKQWRWFAGSPIDIPVEKSIFYVYNMRFGNWYGKSIMKAIRKNWLLKDPILKMWARALDRFGTPLITIYTPDETIDDPDNPGNQISQMEWANRQLKNIQNGTGFTLRSSDPAINGETKVEAITTGGSGIGESFDKAVQYLNKMLLRGMLVPSLIFDEGSRGSYALGESHFSIFNLSVTNIFNRLTETLIEQLVRRLIELNFGRQVDYGKFVENEVENGDVKLLSEAFFQLTNSGYLDSQVQGDFDAVRLKMGLPQREVVKTSGKVVDFAKDAYARYKEDDGVIGDPLAQENDERLDEGGA